MQNSSDILQLVHLPVSPWSERIRFLFDQLDDRFQYELIQYEPPITQLWLRYKMGKLSTIFTESITVPILFLPDGSYINDSFEIYEYVCKQYPGPNLGKINVDVFKKEHIDKVIRIKSLVDKVLEAGRIRGAVAMLNSNELLSSLSPGPFKYLGSIGRAITASFLKSFRDKYMTDEYLDHDENLEIMKRCLFELRKELKSNEGFNYAIPELGFTYADILAATACFGITPTQDVFELQPVLANLIIEKELVEMFPDLLAYRAKLYELHRNPKGRSNL